jgi:phosphatidate cytidylyltransferase
MAFDVKTFLTRLGSAVVFTAVVLGCLLWNEWAFLVLFHIVNIFCLKEYFLIIEKILQTSFSKQEKTNYMAIGIAAFVLITSLPINQCDNQVSMFLSKFNYYFLGVFIGFIIMFFLFKKNKKAIYLLTGISYISLALGLLVQLRFQSLLLPIMLIFFIWMNDTMAYLTGSFIGKTPFAPKISPKKTIEGTLGGIVFAMAFAYIWGANTNYFPVYQWLVIGAIASIAGTVGDLVESKLKRMAGVKDSGMIMPGHGGALDRFDSLLFAAPFAFLFAMAVMKCLDIVVF